jgi:uncharacterized protein (DUF302 family)
VPLVALAPFGLTRSSQEHRLLGLRHSASLSKQEPDSISRRSSAETVSVQEGPRKRRRSMLARRILSAALLAFVLTSPVTARAAENDGIVRIKSAYSMPETIKRLKKDVADKGIMFFDEIDQSKLAADAGVTLRPSTLLVFGNPPLGTLFLTSNPAAGLDWPVRLLVYQDEKGDVWVLYTDFTWIAHRHGITDRDEAFKKASEVIASITSTVK